MKTPFGLRIAYLPFYVEYYESICATFSSEKIMIAQNCAKRLEEYGELIWDGQLIRNVEQAAAIGKLLAAKKIDCVVVFPTIAVFGGLTLTAVRPIDAPILIWNAQQIETVGGEYTMVEIVRNTGQIGAQATANTLFREGRFFRIVAGYEKSKQTAEELSRFFATVRTVTFLRQARLLEIGGPFPAMTDILVDEKLLFKHLGVSLIHVSLDELTRHYNRSAKAPLAATNVEDLTLKESENSVRLSEAVESLAVEHGACGGTLNCHGEVCLRNPDIGITACYSLGIQNSLGRPFTCTGDIPTAMAMLILKKLTGISMYTEIQVMDEKRNAIVLANSGEGEEGMRREDYPARIRGNSNFIGVNGRGASFAYPLKSGPATVISFTPSPMATKPFRLIVTEGEILQETVPDVGALAGFFRFKNGDLRGAYRRWMEAGAVHHAATTMGHWATELKSVAELLDVECIEI